MSVSCAAIQSAGDLGDFFRRQDQISMRKNIVLCAPAKLPSASPCRSSAKPKAGDGHVRISRQLCFHREKKLGRHQISTAAQTDFVYRETYAIQCSWRKFTMLLHESNNGILSRWILPYRTGRLRSSYGLRSHDLRVSRVFGFPWQ
jgi:hypothetical protein